MTQSATPSTDTQANPKAAASIRALLVRSEAGTAAVPSVWGLVPIERLRRALASLGVERCDILDPGEFPPRDTGGSSFLVLRAELVFEDRLLAGLAEAQNVVLADKIPGTSHVEALAAHVDGSGLPAAVAALRGLAYQQVGVKDIDQIMKEGSLRYVAVLDLAPAYNPVLRKHLPPFVFHCTPENSREVENAIFHASYKGITDLVTKWVWPLPARAVVRVLAARAVRPNSVTAVGYVLTVLATWWFIEGWFAAGLLAGWIMTFLDTVDGKLARCTLQSSKLGDFLDHGLDLVHPPIWWAAWAWGLSANFVGYETATGIIVGGYVTGRLLEGVFMLFFKQELFTWRRFDAIFRTVIARRNPNLILLSVGTAMGRPDLGFLGVAFWTVVANVVPAIRITQAFIERSRGVEIKSWYDDAIIETPTEVNAGGPPT